MTLIVSAYTKTLIVSAYTKILSHMPSVTTTTSPSLHRLFVTRRHRRQASVSNKKATGDGNKSSVASDYLISSDSSSCASITAHAQCSYTIKIIQSLLHGRAWCQAVVFGMFASSDLAWKTSTTVSSPRWWAACHLWQTRYVAWSSWRSWWGRS